MVIRTSKIEPTLSTISSNRTLNRLPRQHTDGFTHRHAAQTLAGPADQALQVIRFRTCRHDRMIGRLAPALENLDVAPLLRSQLGKQVVQHSHGDESRATACYQDSTFCQETQGQRLPPAVTPQRL